MAALQAASALTQEVGGSEDYFWCKFQKAKVVYEKLWNGSSIMTIVVAAQVHLFKLINQLAGHWYARACGLSPIVEEDKARSALEKVFNYNVLKIMDGKLWAVNGMLLDGTVDMTTLQSREIWPGLTYVVAATMIHEDLVDMGFQTGSGIYEATWSENGLGYSFQTPEAWSTDGGFRELCYNLCMDIMSDSVKLPAF